LVELFLFKGKSMRILLVEDDTTILRMIHTLLPVLAPAVSIVGACTTLASARAILAHEPLDVIITDNYLPDGRGLELLAEVHNTPLSPDVILMTGNICPDVVQAMMLSGSGSLLPKPFSWSDIMPLIYAIAEKRGLNPNDYQRPLVFSKDLAGIAPKYFAPAAPHTPPLAPTSPPIPEENRVPASVIHIRQNYDDIIIPIASIRYVEAEKHTVIFHTEDGKRYTERSFLGDVEERLKEHHFVRTHRSYLVALAHVERLIPEFVVLRGEGEKIPISKGNTTLVKKAWLAFFGL
jgi:DNA-binding LytR/AlgR family response regulator